MGDVLETLKVLNVLPGADHGEIFNKLSRTEFRAMANIDGRLAVGWTWLQKFTATERSEIELIYHQVLSDEIASPFKTSVNKSRHKIFQVLAQWDEADCKTDWVMGINVKTNVAKWRNLGTIRILFPQGWKENPTDFSF